MSKDKTQILSTKEVNQKITRIAHEIHERHYKSSSLVIVGIKEGGSKLASRLVLILKEISDLDITFIELQLDKNNPSLLPTFESGISITQNQRIIVVDDVINSGRTLIYAVKHILDSQPKSVGTVALIDRIHRRFPLGADYVGMRLSTTIKERVEVDLDRDKEGVYLA